ncbi:hypothetical protein VP01_1531g3 [Puccinia sorghi]|uniref:Uncharacterized protein n=1 Tax=Puccinia sorghi TaxID=27349 RepID=A0A0L6VIE1_9BASI|nr:hypothetical protein VP01_1548g3 [Puccinia sorghi]KNZ60595.1 hypothetical protein VP01_1531g3 [Puccinia sorghi]
MTNGAVATGIGKGKSPASNAASVGAILKQSSSNFPGLKAYSVSFCSPSCKSPLWALHYAFESLVKSTRGGLTPALKIGANGQVKIKNNLTSAALNSLTHKCIKSAMQVEYPLSTDVANQQCIDQHNFVGSLPQKLVLPERILPKQTCKLQLDLYNICMPHERYISKINCLNGMLSDVDGDSSTAMVSLVKELNCANCSKILEIRTTLTKEVRLTLSTMSSLKPVWHPKNHFCFCPPPKPVVLADSQPVSSPVPTANHPAGLPERTPSTNAWLPPPVSRHKSDRKLPSIPLGPINSTSTAASPCTQGDASKHPNDEYKSLSCDEHDSYDSRFAQFAVVMTRINIPTKLL